MRSPRQPTVQPAPARAGRAVSGSGPAARSSTARPGPGGGAAATSHQGLAAIMPSATTTRRTASGSRSSSPGATTRAAWPRAASSPATAAASAPPTSATPVARSIRTAACFSSGWSEAGSRDRTVSALAQPPGWSSGPMWNGRNALPAGVAGSSAARACIPPRADVMRASSPSARPAAPASPGFSRSRGSQPPRSAATRPVRVSVCQRSRSRPVRSRSGRSAVGGSAGSRWVMGTSRGRPSCVWQRPST